MRANAIRPATSASTTAARIEAGSRWACMGASEAGGLYRALHNPAPCIPCDSEPGDAVAFALWTNETHAAVGPATNVVIRFSLGPAILWQ
jgi:hypothetical protein